MLNRLSASLFFPLDEDLYIDRQCTIDRHQGFQRFEDQHGLAFIVTGPTAVQIIAADRRFKRRSMPEVYGINRLHIVMPINKQCWLPWRFKPFTIHEWIPYRLDQPGPFKAHML